MAVAFICFRSYQRGWWTLLLDWAAIGTPTIAGLLAWAMPVKETTNRHRWWLLIGGVLLSILIVFIT
jgi:hypothetical protein